MLKNTILIPEIHKENYSFGKVIRGLSKVKFKTNYDKRKNYRKYCKKFTKK